MIGICLSFRKESPRRVPDPSIPCTVASQQSLLRFKGHPYDTRLPRKDSTIQKSPRMQSHCFRIREIENKIAIEIHVQISP